MSTKEILKPYFDFLRHADLTMHERSTLEALEVRVAELCKELEAAKKAGARTVDEEMNTMVVPTTHLDHIPFWKIPAYSRCK